MVGQNGVERTSGGGRFLLIDGSIGPICVFVLVSPKKSRYLRNRKLMIETMSILWFTQAGKACANPHPETGVGTPSLTSNASRNLKKVVLEPESSCRPTTFTLCRAGDQIRPELPELGLRSERLTSADASMKAG